MLYRFTALTTSSPALGTTRTNVLPCLNVILYSVLLVALLGTASLGRAQTLKFGIQAGLNVSTMLAESEKDASGNNLETNSFVTGFQVGPVMDLLLVPNFGLEANLLYSQKGTRYKYEGAGSYTFINSSGSKFPTTGKSRVIINVSNGYIDLPIMAYYKLTSNLKISGGVNVAVLVSSEGNGEWLYQGAKFASGDYLKNDVAFTLTQNYFRDKAGEISESRTDVTTHNGDKISVPTSLNAYSTIPSRSASRYNSFDFGAVLGVAWVFNSGLQFGIRGNYSLADITANELDNSYQNNVGAPTYAPTNRPIDVRNLSLQAQIGFRF